MSKEEWAEMVIDNMDSKTLYGIAFDVMFNSVKDMSDKEFKEYKIELGYEEEK